MKSIRDTVSAGFTMSSILSLAEFSDSEIGEEIYRKRWAIETLWKFLKMHFKLYQLITENNNGIAIHILLFN